MKFILIYITTILKRKKNNNKIYISFIINAYYLVNSPSSLLLLEFKFQLLLQLICSLLLQMMGLLQLMEKMEFLKYGIKKIFLYKNCIYKFILI